MRNVQVLDLDMEMQEINRGTSREHLLIDFSSSGSSEELDALRKENEEEGVPSRQISPASSDIGVLPSHHHRPSLFHDPEVPLVNLDLAPGRKVVRLVDLEDVEDGMGAKQKDDAWKWFEPPPLPAKIHFTPLDSTPALISKSMSEPLPLIPPLPMSEGKLIDLHSGPEEEEHVLVDLHVQDVPQPQFIPVHTTHVDLHAVVNYKPTTVSAVNLKPSDELRSPMEGRRSLDSLMKPATTATTIVDITTPHFISVERKNVDQSSQRGRRVDRHPLEEEVHEVVEVKEKVEEEGLVGKDDEKLANEHEHHELYDHHDDYIYANDIHHEPQSLGGEEELESSPPSPQVPMVPVQAAPAWYWDHEDDPWNGVVNEEAVKEGENEAVEEGEVVVEEKGGEDDEREVDLMDDVSEMKAGSDDEDTLPGSKSPIDEEVPKDEESYPDPDYLPLPELLLNPSPLTTELPLILVENGLANNFQEDEIQTEDKQHIKDNEKSPRRVPAQMPTPPASPPPPSPLRVKLGGTRSGPPSPRSLSSMGGLLPSATSSPKMAPLVVLTPPNISSPSSAIEVVAGGGDKENADGVDKENEVPSNTTGRPLWSIRADDAPALGLAASSLSISTSGVGTTMGGGVSPRMRMRKVLGDVTSVVENEEKEVVEIKEEEVVKEDMKEETDEEAADEEDDSSSLPGSFPELVKPTGSSEIMAPTITIAALTSTLLSTSIAAAAATSTSTSTSTAPEATSTSPVAIQRRPRQPIVRSPLDIALAMQLRPGLGVGADPAWMVRFLMAMFGWFAILVSGQGEF